MAHADHRTGNCIDLATGREIVEKTENVLTRMLKADAEEIGLEAEFVTEDPPTVSEEYAELTLTEYPTDADVELHDSRMLEKFGFNPTLTEVRLSDDGHVIAIRGSYRGTGLGIRLRVPVEILTNGGAN